MPPPDRFDSGRPEAAARPLLGAVALEARPRSRGRRRPLTLAEMARLGLILSIGAGLVFSAAVAVQVDGGAGALCLVATLALLAVSLPLILDGRGELLDPIWLTVLSVAVGVTGKAFYLILGPRERVEWLLLGRRPEDLLFAALVVAAGMLVFSLGYLAGRVRWRVPGMKRLTPSVWHPRRLTSVIGILVIGGLLAALAFVIRLDPSIGSLADLSSKRFLSAPDIPGRGAVQGYLRWGAMLLEIAFLLAFCGWVASGRRLRSRLGLAVVAIALLAAAFPIFVSSRISLLLMFLRAMSIWLCIRGQPRPRSVIAAALVGLTLAGSMLALRRNQSDWQGIREHLRIDELMQVTVGGRHFLDLTKTGQILDAVPDTVGYQYGRTLVTWLAAPVPRSLWPSKPEIGPNLELGPLFGTPRTGVPPGLVAELYLNFGVVGVAIGLLGLGLVLRSIYFTLRPQFPDKAMVLIFVVLSTRLAFDLPGNSVGGTTVRLLMELIPLTLALIACNGVGAPRRDGSR